MKQIELLIYIIFLVLMLLLVAKYWNTGRNQD
jgi:hypothetical protein